MYLYIIPLITSFTNMEGLLTAMRIAMYIYIYYSLDYLFYRHGARCWEKWELQCLCVYLIPLITYFPIHGGGCSHKWELQCLYVYIIPLITYFPNMVGAAHINENCNVCMCIFFPWLPISPYMEGDAERNENCNVCVCILFPWSPISPNMEGVVHINENCNVYVYVIPLVTYFPKHGGVARINENCNVCMCILFPWSHISQARRGLLREMRVAMSVCVYYYLDHLFPQHGGGGVLTEMRIPMSVYVFYSFDHLFFHHGGGCWEKCVLQCMYDSKKLDTRNVTVHKIRKNARANNANDTTDNAIQGTVPLSIEIVGDSMLNNINSRGISKTHKINVLNVSGLKSDDIRDHLNPSIRRKPYAIICHVGTLRTLTLLKIYKKS